NARVVGGSEDAVDLVVSDGLITDIGSRLQAPDAEEFDLGGRWVMPGLWDHHVHFTLWARTRSRLDVSAAASAADACALVAERLLTDAPAAGTTLEGYGFRDALWPDVPSAAALDAATSATQHESPVVLVSADLHCVWVNTAAQRRYGLASAGLLREAEA